MRKGKDEPAASKEETGASNKQSQEKDEDATTTKRRRRTSALDRKFAFFDLVMERMRESYPRGNSEDEERQQRKADAEDMEEMPNLTAEEVNEMAETFLEFRNGVEEEGETRSSSDLLPVANQVSARNVSVVSGDDNDGDSNVHHGGVVTGFLVTDMTRKALREPIYDSMPWLTPLRLLITGAFLIVILIVSLAVALHTGDTDKTKAFSAIPSTLSPYPTENPSSSAQPTASPTIAPVKWSQVGTDVTSVTGTADDKDLGRSVALSYNGNELRAAGSGILGVYLLAGTNNWILNQDLSSGITSSARVAVSLDGFTTAASDPNHNSRTGKVTFYRRVDAAWEQHGEPLVGTKSLERFGSSVAMNSNGTVVVVGASGGNFVDVFRYQNDAGVRSSPTRVTKIQGDAGSDYGVSVATSSDATRLVVGARDTVVDGRPRVGAAYVYALFPQHYLLQRLDGDEAYDSFGRSVDLSSEGDVLAVGTGALRTITLQVEANETVKVDASGKSNNGYVKVYAANLSRRRYSELADPIREPVTSALGHALSLSADGSRLAVGAPYDEHEGPNGRAFVFAVHPRQHQMIGEFVGDARGDYLGWSVSLSGDGTCVAIGALFSDIGGEDSGLVRVYKSSR